MASLDAHLSSAAGFVVPFFRVKEQGYEKACSHFKAMEAFIWGLLEMFKSGLTEEGILSCLGEYQRYSEAIYTAIMIDNPHVDLAEKANQLKEELKTIGDVHTYHEKIPVLFGLLEDYGHQLINEITFWSKQDNISGLDLQVHIKEFDKTFDSLKQTTELAKKSRSQKTVPKQVIQLHSLVDQQNTALLEARKTIEDLSIVNRNYQTAFLEMNKLERLQALMTHQKIAIAEAQKTIEDLRGLVRDYQTAIKDANEVARIENSRANRLHNAVLELSGKLGIEIPYEL